MYTDWCLFRWVTQKKLITMRYRYDADDTIIEYFQSLVNIARNWKRNNWFVGFFGVGQQLKLWKQRYKWAFNQQMQLKNQTSSQLTQINGKNRSEIRTNENPWQLTHFKCKATTIFCRLIQKPILFCIQIEYINVFAAKNQWKSEEKKSISENLTNRDFI